jgi:hypothetical protein
MEFALDDMLDSAFEEMGGEMDVLSLRRGVAGTLLDDEEVLGLCLQLSQTNPYSL